MTKRLHSVRTPSGVYPRGGKRLLDLTLASVLLLCLAPVILLVIAFVRSTLGAPVLFRQERSGQHGKPFELLKFRSMRAERYKDESDTDRLTRSGHILRRSSLDELPSLWNVLRGEMSLVGPRPLLPRYLPWYTDEERLRFAVRPGITGLAQISGRNYLDWNSKLACDVAYVETLSPSSDAKILWRTLFKVATAADVAADNENVEQFLDLERKALAVRDDLPIPTSLQR